MNKTTPQQKIGIFIYLGLGLISLLCLFNGLYLWAGIIFIVAALVANVLKGAGIELSILISIMIILVHYGQRELVGFLSFLIMIIAICDLYILAQIIEELSGMEKVKKKDEFRRRFRQREALHALLMKIFRRNPS